jgi:hypothetical protein
MRKYNVCLRCGEAGYLVLLADGTEAWVTHNGRLRCRPRRIGATKKRKKGR